MKRPQPTTASSAAHHHDHASSPSPHPLDGHDAIMFPPDQPDDEFNFGADNFDNTDAINASPPPPSRRQQQTEKEKPPSMVILHRIASYLSLGDAESMASLSRPSPLNGVASSHSACLLPGYHSLDHYCFYSSSNSKASPSGGGSLGRGRHATTSTASQESMQHHHNIHFQQTLSSIIDSNDEQDNDQEDWFVGSGGLVSRSSSSRHHHHHLRDYVSSIGFDGTSSTPPTPDMVALSPLEEEWEVGGPPPPPPAGEPTCEKNEHDSHYNSVTIVSSCSTTSSLAEEDDATTASYFIRREHRQRRQALQNKLASAVFAHPHPLREYCLDAYATALKLSRKRQEQLVLAQAQYERDNELRNKQQQQQPVLGEEGPPETMRDKPCMSPSTALHGPEMTTPELGEHNRSCQKQVDTTTTRANNMQQYRQQRMQRHQKEQKMNRTKILRIVMSKLLNSVPLSVLLDLVESTFDLSVDTLFAAAKIGSFTMKRCISILCDATLYILDILSSINPFHVFEFVLNAQRTAMGRTGEVLVSGIQSVATGVGSASNAALNRLSRQGLALAGGVVGGSASGLSRGGGMSGTGGFGRSRRDVGKGENPLESKVSQEMEGHRSL